MRVLSFASPSGRRDQMTFCIGRRTFITLLGGAAAGWPRTAWAQKGEPLRRLGVLMNLSEDDAEGQARVGAFRDGLQKLGWIEGRNIQIEYRWVAGVPQRIRSYAVELVSWKPDVIFAARLKRYRHCSAKPERCRLYSPRSSIRSDQDSLRASHAQAGISPALLFMSSRSPGNGSSCSSRLLLM
jgi:hypothetical protein